MPTLMSDNTQPSATGITAQPIIARTKVSIGAIRKTTRFAPVGMINSLVISLSASAKGCSRPNGPTTLGPMRNCINPITLRSA